MYSVHNSGAFLLLTFVALFVLNSSDDNSKMLNDKNWFCSEESGFSETSDVVCYKSILKNLLNSLPTKILYNDTFTNGVIFGLFFCQGDISNITCQKCVEEASHVLLSQCPLSMNATVWLDECMLRCSGTKTNISFGECDSVNISSPEATSFGPFGVRDLMNRLIDEALKTDGFFKAGHQSLGNGSYYGYGLAQCTRDLNKTQCANCLKKLVEGPFGNNSLQAVPPFRMFSSTCYLRYANYSFIQQQPALSPLLSTQRRLFSSPAPSMPLPRTSPSRSGKMYTPFIIK